MKFLVLVLVFLFVGCSSSQKQETTKKLTRDYQDSWWKGIPKAEKKRWEISPDSVEIPKVILSKRNELGIFSNFADTPFEYQGKKFGSMEGLWQSMKYPEDENDPRFKMAKWPHTRAEVEMMTGFKAKRAGDFGSKVMKKNNIDWVSFKNKRMKYREKGKGEFYEVIVGAMGQKLADNDKVYSLLCSTGDLQFLPDHSQGKNPPAAWKYHQIWMDYRSTRCQ